MTNRRPSSDCVLPIVEEPEICEECGSVSRLTNGLCLNCLLRGALDDQDPRSGQETFKEVLAAVKSRDGDWFIAEHEILDEIARGAMGVVYQAKEPHSGRIVALKCVLTWQSDSDQVVARFRREAETAARLDHPNIVPIYQVGETADGFPYYTMKYAEAGSLLEARQPLLQHPRQIAELIIKVTRAVHYAHEHGVLHRDLKPGNILLDSHGQPLVSDFGLARSAEVSGLTRSLSSFGTPGYIAPEQADGPSSLLTPAADIYSLGAILFELLTGQTPFVGDNAFSVMKRSAVEPAPKLRELAPRVDRNLETICARCLEREPADRYQSAAALADDLQNWLDDRPIVARPAGPWTRSRRWVRDNPRLAALVGLFCVFAAVATGWKIHERNLKVSMQESILASHSIGVLPFYDLDNAVANEQLTQTAAASLESGLAVFGPARITILNPPFIVGRDRIGDVAKEGHQEQTRAILSGTVRTSKGRKRIALQLLDPATKETLLTHVLEVDADGSLSKVFASEINEAIYSILSTNDWSNLIRSKSDPGLGNPVAYEAITAGRLISHNNAEDCDKKIALFRKAVQAQPNSSLAHAYFAMEATARTHYIPDRTFLEVGKNEALLALQLSPGSVEAHRALAGVYYQEGNFLAALEQGLQTVEIGGLDDRVAILLGMTLDMLGRTHQALGWSKVAAQLASTPGEVDTAIGDYWTKLVGDEQAERAYQRASELRPNAYDGTLGMARLRLLQGDFEAARELCRTLPVIRGEPGNLTAQIEFFARNFELAKTLYSKLAKENPEGGGSFFGAVTYHSAIGRAQQALGENDQGRIVLEECLMRERAIADRENQNPEALYRLAAVEASLGLREISLSHLRKAVALGWVDYRSLNLDPRFDPLRGPEFQTVINELSAKVAGMRSQTISK
jgi:serine/threonine protein kinase/Tfp pilus assembly protein PilF